jgi:hypothetical protein
MHKVRFVVVYATLLAALTNAQTATLRYLSGDPRPRAHMAKRFDPRRIETPMANMQMLDGPPPPETKWTQGLTAWRVAEGAWLLHKHAPYSD